MNDIFYYFTKIIYLGIVQLVSSPSGAFRSIFIFFSSMQIAWLLVFHGLCMIISGSIYAFSPTYTPWHKIAIDNHILSDGAQRVMFSLYRVVGWSVMICGFSVALLSWSTFIVNRRSKYYIQNNLPIWITILLLSLIPTTSSLIVSFQVGWKVCPWYMPALGVILASFACHNLYPR